MGLYLDSNPAHWGIPSFGQCRDCLCTIWQARSLGIGLRLQALCGFVSPWKSFRVFVSSDMA